MAKISAYGAHKVAEVRVRRVLRTSDDDWHGVLVLCSDGRILRASVLDGRRLGYKLVARAHDPATADIEMLRRYASRRGYELG